MEHRIRQLLNDLEQYIQENWTAPEDEESLENPVLEEGKVSVPEEQYRAEICSKNGFAYCESG